MATFNLSVKIDNEAFEGKTIFELKRIFEKAIENMEKGNTSGKIFDHNGNHVGEFHIGG